MVDGLCPRCGKPVDASGTCPRCGAPASESLLPPGTVLRDRYEVERLLHTGGMSQTYLARDRTLFGRSCVVKQVSERIQSEPHQTKLAEEALRMARLSHPGIAVILDQFVERGYYFLVVELVIGKTLSEVSKERRGRLLEADVVRWGIAMCDVVTYIHNEGIIHRDISPDNVMLTEEGAVKFIDFGTLREARYVAAGKTAGMGKYGYTPPEQWDGRPAPQSDVFALGATLYSLLTGFLPLSESYLAGGGPQPADYAPQFPPIRAKNPVITPRLEVVLQKALQLDLDDRYPSAAALQADLRAAAGLAPAPPAGVGRRAAEAAQYPPTLLAAAVCVISLAYLVLLAPIYGWWPAGAGLAAVSGALAAWFFRAHYLTERVRPVEGERGSRDDGSQRSVDR